MPYDWSSLGKALENTCPVCQAPPGEMCSEEAVPEEDKDGWHADRLRHSGPAIVYTTERVKPYAELRPSDVPPGLDPDDFATDLVKG